MSGPKIDDGGLAFPYVPPLDPRGGVAQGYDWPAPGMSLRDWFAGLALQGWLASCVNLSTHPVNVDGGATAAANQAYAMADAMIAARKLPALVDAA